MTMKMQALRGGLVLSLVLATALAACGNTDNPQSPAPPAAISGTVISNASGDPVSGVQVDLERFAGGHGMMQSGDWNHMEHVMTDAGGHFGFHYSHDTMHRYRVAVHGSSYPDGMCNLDNTDPHQVVLRVP